MSLVSNYSMPDKRLWREWQKRLLGNSGPLLLDFSHLTAFEFHIIVNLHNSIKTLLLFFVLVFCWACLVHHHDKVVMYHKQINKWKRPHKMVVCTLHCRIEKRDTPNCRKHRELQGMYIMIMMIVQCNDAYRVASI